jgi:dolichyl-phosphate-mannose-protein mannosyltransferase
LPKTPPQKVVLDRVTAEEQILLLFYRTCLTGIALGVVATLYFLAGLSGQIGNPVPNVLTAAIFIGAAIYFLYLFFVWLFEKNWLGCFLWLAILLIMIVEISLGLVPPAARDELTHHLLVPRLYVNAGRIFEIPFDYPSFYPMLLEMLFIPWVKWGWDFVPKLIHGLYGFLTGLLLYCYLGRRLSPHYGLLGFFLFVSTPAILQLSNLGYVDLGLIFYATASLLCILRWVESREAGKSEPRWLVLVGLLGGFGAATKPNGLLVLLLLFFTLAWTLGRAKTGVRQAAVLLTVFVCLAILPLAPWLARNFVWKGNPFFPFFSSFFDRIASGGIVTGSGAALGIFEKRHLLYGESAWEIAALPLRLFFSGEDDRPQYFDGVLNPMLILFLPWAFQGKWLEEKKILFGFAALQLLFGLFMVDLRVRYILPLVPPLVILLVYAVHNIYLRIARPFYLFAVLILLVAMNGLYLWRYVELVSPLNFLAGRESRSEYLTRVMPDYRVMRYANENLPTAARIYLLFMGRRAYYCERDYYHDGGDNAVLLVGLIGDARESADIEFGLRKRGLTHLMVRTDLLLSYLKNNLTTENSGMWNGFVRAHLRTVYQDESYAVLEIHG